ncbi:hypothetical protein Aperf_G00000051547 [Anoplocephala perfoliata]
MKIPISGRIKKELREFDRYAPTNCSASPIDESDLYHWEGTIVGPEGTPYEGGIFKLIIELPLEYPFRPPKVKFKTPIYHPNIDGFGTICVDILGSAWSPTLTISKGNHYCLFQLLVLLSISSLLAEPNPLSALQKDIAEQYINNHKEYYKTAKDWTQEFARQL